MLPGNTLGAPQFPRTKPSRAVVGLDGHDDDVNDHNRGHEKVVCGQAPHFGVQGTIHQSAKSAPILGMRRCGRSLGESKAVGTARCRFARTQHCAGLTALRGLHVRHKANEFEDMFHSRRALQFSPPTGRPSSPSRDAAACRGGNRVALRNPHSSDTSITETHAAAAPRIQRRHATRAC